MTGSACLLRAAHLQHLTGLLSSLVSTGGALIAGDSHLFDLDRTSQKPPLATAWNPSFWTLLRHKQIHTCFKKKIEGSCYICSHKTCFFLALIVSWLLSMSAHKDDGDEVCFVLFDGSILACG